MANKPRALKVPIHYGNRYEVSAWLPSKQQETIAHERTEGLVGYFLSCCDRHNPVKWQDQLYTLARSCYLQGTNDMATVAAEMRIREGKLK